MNVYADMAENVNRIRTQSAQGDPEWIVWHGPSNSFAMKFVDGDELPEHAWQQVLELCMRGYRADRIGNSVHITGHPFGFEGGIA